MTSQHPFRVLIANAAILRRIRELAAQIGRDYGAELPTLVVVIEGARTFARQLAAHLPRACRAIEVRASSYGDGTVSSGKVIVGTLADTDVAGRRVLLVEDIVDTGRTVAALRAQLLATGALDCRVATLLNKPVRRTVDVALDYVGFEIPDEFVIGYGMDYAGRYREINEVVVYEADRVAAGG